MASSSAKEFMNNGKSILRAELQPGDGVPKATASFKKAILIDPISVEAILYLADMISRVATSSTGYLEALGYNSWARAVAPNDSQVIFRSGLLRRNMGRKDLALPEFVRASSISPERFRAAHVAATTAMEMGEISIARTHIERCLKINPHHDESLAAKKELDRKEASRNRQIISRFPESLDEMADFPEAISKHLLDELTFPRVLSRSSRIFAAGSCFATNIAKVLIDQGYTANANNFGESINSTLANREYFEWFCAEEPYESEFSKLISPALRDATRECFLRADVIILTIGVAPVFLEKGTGKLRLQGDDGLSVRRLLRECEFRTLSVSENVENITHILKTIRGHRPQAEIFITLSPVPLNATFEYPSAIIADCVSKSVLRVAVDEVFRQQPAGVHYWPAFEAVRWIGGYRGDAYGADDGATRHVSDHIIQAITSAFIERTKSTSR